MPVQDDLICRSGGQNIAWGPFGGDLEDWVRHGWQRKNVKARILKRNSQFFFVVATHLALIVTIANFPKFIFELV